MPDGIGSGIDWFDSFILKEHSGTLKHDRTRSYDGQWRVPIGFSFCFHTSWRPCLVAKRQGVTVLNADRKQPDQLKRAIAAATWRFHWDASVSWWLSQRSEYHVMVMWLSKHVCRASLDTKAGKFDIVFDNNVRKLEEIQPVVQGIKARYTEWAVSTALGIQFLLRSLVNRQRVDASNSSWWAVQVCMDLLKLGFETPNLCDSMVLLGMIWFW